MYMIAWPFCKEYNTTLTIEVYLKNKSYYDDLKTWKILEAIESS